MRPIFLIFLFFILSCNRSTPPVKNPLPIFSDSVFSDGKKIKDKNTVSDSDSSGTADVDWDWTQGSDGYEEELSDPTPDMIIVESNTNHNPKKIVRVKPESDIKTGNLVYDIPDTMIVGKLYIIRIRINRDTSDKTISEGLSTKSISTGIRTTYKMEVSVIDPSDDGDKYFNITKSNENTQLVEDSGYTEWVYGITPLKSGRRKINLVISIIKGDNKKQVVYLDEVWVKSNAVVAIKKGWNDNWKWWMTTIIIPLIIWLYNRRKKKESKE